MPSAISEDDPFLEENDGVNGYAKKEKKANVRLILCFDGTGNQFADDTSNTNIVKLYHKFNRETPDQFHYYQPGIGTYTADINQSVNTGLWGKFKRWLSQTVDQGIGTTFDQHVIAGYRFVMRYFDTGDKIFMFGFSRGAFTARFLARMIATVGVLSKGNEELVPFAYRAYQEYEAGKKFKDVDEAESYMKNFKAHFCRTQAKVHFLGLFDTVNSVGYFDAPFQTKKFLPSVLETASHVRHAVSIDERRCKFKPALLSQDQKHASAKTEDIKEVFFPGNHGDVGGGWLAPGGKGRIEQDDPLQLSDLAMEWMINELEELGRKHPLDKVAWNEHKDIFLTNFHKKVKNAVTAPIHDVLKFGGGVSPFATFMWRLMEYIPIFKRLELNKEGKWVPETFPPNMCGTRDIPPGAEFHPSVKARMQTKECKYRPTNDGILKC